MALRSFLPNGPYQYGIPVSFYGYARVVENFERKPRRSVPPTRDHVTMCLDGCLTLSDAWFWSMWQEDKEAHGSGVSYP